MALPVAAALALALALLCIILLPCYTMWQALQPPIFREEEADFITSRTSLPKDDLSREVVEGAANRVFALKAFREQKRQERIESLTMMWDRLLVPTAAREEVLQQAKDPTQAAFGVLDAEESLMRAGLVEPMRKVQNRLIMAWSKLKIPYVEWPH